MGKVRNVYKILVGKYEEKIRRERTRSRLEDNIRIDLREIGWEVVDMFHLAPDRDQWWVLVNTVLNLRVP
jgi:hypothetical protein